ncbi:MAG: oligosaccharide flippase family protein [Bulleidia sp.]
MKKKKNLKNSLLMGGMIGTAGMFVAKLIGLLYSIPLSSILGSDMLMSYYGTAYRVYSYILNVFTAGIPFAICTLVAKYTTLEDNRSLLKIRKLSRTMLGIFGFFGMLLLMALSYPLAKNVCGNDDPSIMMTVFLLLSIALFFVPILSAYRGFWQGRKEMVEYAVSQSFEQIFRVGFLLSTAYVIVYTMGKDRTYALYAAVLSTSVAAIAGIIQIYFFDKTKLRPIQSAAKHQKFRSVKNRELCRELLILAGPYLLTSMIGYIDDILNSTLLPIGLRLYGYSAADNSVILSAFNYVGTKLCSIPQILSPGFAAALIPYITEAVTNNDRKKISSMMTECIGIVFLIGAFLSSLIAIYSTDIFNVLFYTSNQALSADVTRWMAIEGFLGTICPIISSLMLAAGLRKAILRRQMITAVIKAVLIVPMTMFLGYRGAILSSMIGSLYFFIANLVEIDLKFNIYLKKLMKNFLLIAVSLLVSFGVSYALRMIGLDGSTGSRIAAFGKLCINGVVMMCTYFGLTELFGVPKALFHRSMISVVTSRLKRS